MLKYSEYSHLVDLHTAWDAVSNSKILSEQAAKQYSAAKEEFAKLMELEELTTEENTTRRELYKKMRLYLDVFEIRTANIAEYKDILLDDLEKIAAETTLDVEAEKQYIADNERDVMWRV